MSIDEYNKVLQNYLLKKVIFKVDNKVLKAGKIKLFNIKQYFIRFNIENDKGEIKQLELPYPFTIKDKDNICTLNYQVSSFCKSSTSRVFKEIKDIENSEMMRIYDRVVNIIPII